MVWVVGSLSYGWLWYGCVVVAGTGGTTLPRNELLLSRVLDLTTPRFFATYHSVIWCASIPSSLLPKGRLVSRLFTLFLRMLLFSASHDI